MQDRKPESGQKTASGPKAFGISGIRVAAFVLAISSAFLVFLEDGTFWSVIPYGVALVCAYFAERLWRARAGPRSRRAAIAVLSFGYLGLALGVLVHGFVEPPSREYARRAACKNNLKQMRLALQEYAADYKGWFPVGPPDAGGAHALGLLAADRLARGGVVEMLLFVCPSAPDSSHAWLRGRDARAAGWLRDGLQPESTSYEYVPGFKDDLPPEFVLVYDKSPDYHKQGRNVLLGDMSVKWLVEADFRARVGARELLLRLMRERPDRVLREVGKVSPE